MIIKTRPFHVDSFTIKAVISLLLLAASSILCEEGIYIQNLDDLDKEMSPSPDALEHEICPREINEGQEHDPHHVVYFDTNSEPELSYVDSVDVAINEESEENNFDKPTFNVFSNYFPEKSKDKPYFRPEREQVRRYYGGGPPSFLVDTQPEANFFNSLKEESRLQSGDNDMFHGFRRFSSRLPGSRLNEEKTIPQFQDRSFQNVPHTVKRHPYFRSEVYRYMKPRKSEESKVPANSDPFKRFDFLSNKYERGQNKWSGDPNEGLKNDMSRAHSAKVMRNIMKL